MYAVVNRIRLANPIPDEVYAEARREVLPRAGAIDGLRAMHLIRAGEDELIVVVLADTEDALERAREEIGNDWMRANVIAHAAGPPVRLTGEVAASFQRG